MEKMKLSNRKYQVFVSSTYTDLIEERKKILDILLRADCIPAGMESFVATDNEQFEVIKRVIDLCDYYILILGMRYGSINPTTEKSYTEMEYEYAKEKGIPVLVFAIDDTIVLQKDKIESDSKKIAKLQSFRENALTNRLASIWTSCEDLIGKVAISIMSAKTEIARPGWQRAVDYDEASLRKQIMNLTEENTKIEKDLKTANKTISDITSNDTLSFDDCVYDISYTYTVSNGYGTNGRRNFSTRNSIETISLPKIFEAISTEMMDVSIVESKIKEVIENLIDCNYSASLKDKQIVKRILNQLKQLNLIKSHWSDSAKNLYWGLTSKGEKKRNDMILIK